MSPKSFFSLSRMCFDVLSIKRQRRRMQREPILQPNLLYVALAAATGRGGVRRRDGEGTDDTVYPQQEGKKKTREK